MFESEKKILLDLENIFSLITKMKHQRGLGHNIKLNLLLCHNDFQSL